MILRKKRYEMLALHEHDLEQLLKKLGLLEEFKQGKLTCCFCGNPITSMSDIGAVLSQDGKFLVSCGKYECLEKAFAKTR